MMDRKHVYTNPCCNTPMEGLDAIAEKSHLKIQNLLSSMQAMYMYLLCRAFLIFI